MVYSDEVLGHGEWEEWGGGLEELVSQFFCTMHSFFLLIFGKALLWTKCLYPPQIHMVKPIHMVNSSV